MRRGTVLIFVALLILGGLVGIMMLINKSRTNTNTTQPATIEQHTENQSDTNSQPSSNNTENTTTTQTNEVEIEDFVYKPSNITVKKGTTVKWTNKDSAGHTVTSDNDSKVVFDSPLLAKGESFSFTFNETGTFSYHCQPHPNMTASVTVTD